MTTLVDTHCHLDAAEFAADREEVHARAQAGDVGDIVIPAVTTANFEAVRTAATLPGCHAAYGLHPMYVNECKEEDLAALRSWVERERPVAIGEIGLDFFVRDVEPARQEFFFTEQLKIARDFDLPVLLHIRRAQDQVLKWLRRFGIKRGIAHAFNGSRQQAEAYLAQGLVLGFGGAMTFPRALRIRELAAKLPLEALVLETDAPDIPPNFIDVGRNSPEYLPGIAAVLAELRGLDLEHIAQATTANAQAVLPGLARLTHPIANELH